MKKKLILLTAILFLLLHGNSFAESNWSAGTGPDLSASSRLKVKVIVPRIIILRVGHSGSFVDTVSWNAVPNPAINDNSYSGSIPANATELPYAASDTVASSNGIISFRVWSNGGTVTLKATADDLMDSNTTYTLPVTSIQSAQLSGQNIIFNGSAIVFNPANNGITSYQRNNWPFTFTPPNPMPAAGNYKTKATYTASIP